MVRHYFAALHGKRFVLSDIAQELPLLAGIHVPTLACMLNVLQLLFLELSEYVEILCLFYSLFIALQRHTTSQSEYTLLRLIVYQLNAMTAFSHKIP